MKGPALVGAGAVAAILSWLAFAPCPAPLHVALVAMSSYLAVVVVEPSAGVWPERTASLAAVLAGVAHSARHISDEAAMAAVIAVVIAGSIGGRLHRMRKAGP